LERGGKQLRDTALFSMSRILESKAPSPLRFAGALQK
jgi:hypothetical protein